MKSRRTDTTGNNRTQDRITVIQQYVFIGGVTVPAKRITPDKLLPVTTRSLRFYIGRISGSHLAYQVR